jgi:hypothetical protein
MKKKINVIFKFCNTELDPMWPRDLPRFPEPVFRFHFQLHNVFTVFLGQKKIKIKRDREKQNSSVPSTLAAS